MQKKQTQGLKPFLEFTQDFTLFIAVMIILPTLFHTTAKVFFPIPNDYPRYSPQKPTKKISTWDSKKQGNILIDNPNYKVEQNEYKTKAANYKKYKIQMKYRLYFTCLLGLIFLLGAIFIRYGSIKSAFILSSVMALSVRYYATWGLLSDIFVLISSLIALGVIISIAYILNKQK